MNIQQAEAGSAPQDFTFRGSASEFFGIWITNLLLSIVTLGIYSAWAKVRVKKYFYQNTYVAGRNFDYHATGGQIFIGRPIVVAGLVAYSFPLSGAGFGDTAAPGIDSRYSLADRAGTAVQCADEQLVQRALRI